MFETISTPARPNWMLRIAFVAVIVALGAGSISLWRMTQMPLKSYKGPLPALSQSSRNSPVAFHSTSSTCR